MDKQVSQVLWMSCILLVGMLTGAVNGTIISASSLYIPIKYRIRLSLGTVDL